MWYRQALFRAKGQGRPNPHDSSRGWWLCYAMQSVIQEGISFYPETIFFLTIPGLLESSSFSEGIFLFFCVSDVLL